MIGGGPTDGVWSTTDEAWSTTDEAWPTTDEAWSTTDGVWSTTLNRFILFGPLVFLIFFVFLALEVGADGFKGRFDSLVVLALGFNLVVEFGEELIASFKVKEVGLGQRLNRKVEVVLDEVAGGKAWGECAQGGWGDVGREGKGKGRRG